MGFRFFRTFDDRGNEVVYRDPMDHGTQLSDSERKRMGAKPGKIRGWIFGLSIMISFASWAFRMRQWSFAKISIHLGIVVVFTLIATWMVLPLIRRMLWSWRWQAKYKAIGRCPACQYSLVAIDPEQDGATVCPECGGAWRMTTY